MPFDPCREWLGIDAVDLDTPHLVLGLRAGETDPVAVGRAAAARLSILHALVPGPFVVARDALVKRVEEARDGMLAALPPPGGMAAASPGGPRQGIPPLPRGAAPGPPAADPALPWMAPVAGGRGELPFDVPPAARGPAHHPPHHHHHHPSRTADSSVTLATLALLLAAATGLGGYWYASRDRADRQVAQRTTQKPAERAAGGGAEQPAQPREQPADRARPRPRTRPDPAPAAQPAPAPAGEMAFLPAPVRPPPAEPPPQLDAAAAARATAAVDASLRQAFAAITGRDFAAADRVIRAARDQAGDDPDLHQRIDRWNLFNDYSREFMRHAADALKAANAGRDYPLGRTRIAVIESTPTMLVYKQTGEVKRVPRERIPHDVLTAIVGTWFAADGRAANHIVLGVHHLAQPQPDVAAARREWQTAANGGESMAGMMPLLDDPIIRGAAGGR